MADRIFRDDYELRSLVNRWRNYIAREDRFNRYAEMTSHGPAHVEGVATLVTEVAMATDFLTDAEKFVLLACAYLHDVGTYTTYDPYYENPMMIRALHGPLSMQRIRRESHLLLPTLYEDEARLIALLCSYHQGKAALSDVELLAKPSHKRLRQPFYENNRGVLVETAIDPGEQPSLEQMLRQGGEQGREYFRLSQYGLGSNDPNAAICPFLLATLLKFLDGCDFQVGRTGNTESFLRHADRNQSHLQRSEFIVRDSSPGSSTAKRATIEAEFFRGSDYHFLRNLLIEKTAILFDKAHRRFEVVIKPADPDEVVAQCETFLSGSPWVEKDASLVRLREIIDVVKRYQRAPNETIMTEICIKEDNPFLKEWNVAVPEEKKQDRKTVHAAVARAYIERELNDVADALVSPAKDRDYCYCAICSNRERKLPDGNTVDCPLRKRSIPTFRKDHATWNISAFHPDKHLVSLQALPYLAPQKTAPHVDTKLARPSNKAGVVRSLKTNKQLLLYGPRGRGKTGCALAAARSLVEDHPHRTMWHSVARQGDQVEALVRSLADFLATNGQFMLANLIRDAHVTPAHAKYAIRLLQRGVLAKPEGNVLLCLNHFNRLERGTRTFFEKVIECFGCLTCKQAHECEKPLGHRWGCDMATSYSLVLSTRIPSWHQQHTPEGIPIKVAPAPTCDPKHAERAVHRFLQDDGAADNILKTWADYGWESVGGKLLERVNDSVLKPSEKAGLFAEEMAAFFASNFGPDGLAGEREAAVLRLVSLLPECLTPHDVKSVLQLSDKLGENALDGVMDRGLVWVEQNRLTIHPAWTKGHVRSGWQDRLSLQPWQVILRFVALGDSPCATLRKSWERIAPYVPELAALAELSGGPHHQNNALEHSFATVECLGNILALLDQDFPEHADTIRQHLAQPVPGGKKLWSDLTRGQLLRIAALYHGIGKAESYRQDDPKASFLQHEKFGAARWKGLAADRGMPDSQAEFVMELIRDYMYPLNLFQEKQENLSEKALTEFAKETAGKRYELLLLLLANLLAGGQMKDRRKEIIAFISSVLAFEVPEIPVACLSGEDLLAEGLQSGPKLGYALKQANDAWRNNPDMTRDEVVQVAKQAYNESH